MVAAGSPHFLKQVMATWDELQKKHQVLKVFENKKKLAHCIVTRLHLGFSYGLPNPTSVIDCALGSFFRRDTVCWMYWGNFEPTV